MTDILVNIFYALGTLWGFRFGAGAVIHEMKNRDGSIEGADIILGMLVGSFAALLWVPLAIGRIVYVGWVKFGAGNSGFLLTLFPEPKAVETRAQKRERIEWEKKEEIRRHRTHVNNRERELGLTLTKWN